MALNPILEYIRQRRTGVPAKVAANRFISSYQDRRNALIVARARSADVSGRKPQGPITREGYFFSKPNIKEETITGMVRPTKTETLREHILGKYYTAQAYEQYTQKQIKQSIGLQQSLKPGTIYLVDGVPVLGYILRKRIQREVTRPNIEALKQFKAIKSSGYVFDIQRTETGFKFINRGLKETGPSLSGYASWFLHAGERAYESLTAPQKYESGYVDINTGQYVGPKETPASWLETREAQQLRLGLHQADIKAWKQGDVGYYAKAIISNPYTTAFISGGIGAISTGLQYSTWGSRAFLGSNLVTRSTAIQAWVGAAGGSYMAGSLTRTYLDEGITGARRQIGQTVLYTPAAIGGYQVGQYYGYGLPGKVGSLTDTFNKAYTTYTPQSTQRIFSAAKQNVLSYDPSVKLFIQRHTPKFFKTYFSRLSPKSVFAKYQNIRASYIGKRYAAELSYYGPELYPYARRAGLVKPRGMFKLSELKIPYENYGTYTGFAWPERDIRFMPHGTETRTQVYLTAKGVKVVSRAIDESSIARYTVKPLDAGGLTEKFGIGKKGGIISRMKPTEPFKYWAEGEIYQKVYTAQGSPYDLIPSIRRFKVHGITRAIEIPNLSGDITAFKTYGSFNITPAPLKLGGSIWRPGLTIIDHRFTGPAIDTTQPFSFGGRLFKENLYTEGISLSKQLDNSLGVPGTYGFKTIELPKVTITKSFGKYWGVKGFGYSQDISLTIIPKPKTTPLWESFAGDAAGIGKSYYVKSPDLVQLPGGIGGSLKDTSLMNLIKNQFAGLSTAYMPTRVSSIETPVIISNFWKGVAPNMQQNIAQSIRHDIMPLPLVTLPKYDLRNVTGMVTETRQDILSSMKIDTRQIQELQPLQKQIQKLIPIQINIQALRVIPRTVTPTINIPTIITPAIILQPPTITPPPPVRPPPPPVFITWDDEKRKPYAWFKIKEMSLGYRFRKWKTPKLEDLLNIKL